MKIFSPMYDACLRWAKHQYAVYYLGVMSFLESVIFPIPVDVMLAPMCLSRLEKAWYFALVATITSVLGGIAGFWLGAYLGQEVIEPLFVEYGMGDSYNKASELFIDYGVWIVFIAGFAPIPYKVFTISAGMMNMALIPFAIASLVGRAGRFYLVAGLIKLGGKNMEKKLRDIVDTLGWAVVAVAILAYLLYKYL